MNTVQPWTEYLNEIVDDLIYIKDKLENAELSKEEKEYQIELLKTDMKYLQELRDNLNELPQKINKILTDFA